MSKSTLPTARKLGDADGVRKASQPGLNTLWTISGRTGLFKYDTGCKVDTVAEDKNQIVATTGENQFAIFSPDVPATAAVADALGVDSPFKRKRKAAEEAATV